MRVVEVVGVRPNGQTSAGAPVNRQVFYFLPALPFRAGLCQLTVGISGNDNKS